MADSTTISAVLIGDESLLIACARLLSERGHAIKAVITENAAVRQWAGSEGLRVIAARRGWDAEIAELSYDWFFSIANLRMLPAAVWKSARHGAANFHDGPLPRYAGLNTPAWAIMNGETEYGVTWHALSDGVDTGEIYVRAGLDIASDDTAFTLNTKCFEAGIASFASLLTAIETGTLTGEAQDTTNRLYFGRNARPSVAGTIDWTQPAAAIDRLCRGLDFGPGYVNPLALPKVRTASGVYCVSGVTFDAGGEDAAAGTVLASGDGGAVIAAGGGAIRIRTLLAPCGSEVLPASVLREGDVLPPLAPNDAERLGAIMNAITPHEAFHRKQVRSAHDIDLYPLKPAGTERGALGETSIPMPDGLDAVQAVAALAAGLMRVAAQDGFSLLYAGDRIEQAARDFPGYVAGAVPLAVPAPEDTTVSAFTARMQRRLTAVQRAFTYPADLVHRYPGATPPRLSIAVRLAGAPEAAALTGTSAVTFIVHAQARDGMRIRVLYDSARLSREEAEALCQRIGIAAAAFAAAPDTPVAALPIMPEDEYRHLLYGVNQTALNYDRAALVHTLIEAQTARTPDAIAVVCGGVQLTYAELDARANRVAAALFEAGCGPDMPVGLYMQRSVDLVVGALAILKAGAAYVPLDPAYPADRLALMIEDSGLAVIVTDERSAAAVPSKSARILTIEAAAAHPANGSPVSRARPDNLAYVIYTSGSTGRPKGVMVEHRNVVNFFVGMDDRIARPEGTQPVWLAVTSLSFDISVLELFWTLARGFKVVIHVDGTREAATAATPAIRPRPAGVRGGMDFSLFYWGHDDATSPNKYHLLLEGARFADNHGFRAVWTPERHFHAFGGPYPNPAVTGAAVAAVTRNLEVRAGSCVLPLHHPARVAEEWAVVDNITGGRVALAFASGWMPEDFVLRPENAPPHNKAALFRDIDVVRRLWRGEKVAFEAPGGKTVEIVTQPRPLQRELPVWVTTAGNPDTYREAARAGANVLTHLLGQSIAELAQKIAIYREALREAGRNPADFTVTLMLHTLVGDSRDAVREAARQPMKDYLRSAAALIKQYAWAFPAFKKPQGATQAMDVDLQSLDPEEMDAIIEFAFLRYFNDSGLFGTVNDAVARVAELKAIGVDEVACLIDFGVSSDVALRGLPPLARVVSTVNAGVVAAINAAEPVVGAASEPADHSIGGLIRRHGVTHLQCTPSMATMILASEDDRAALGSLAHLFIGGEALQGTLLRDLRSVTRATIENMYGPTETTIWSSTATASDTDTLVPLGTPIANTQLYILDPGRQPRPTGLPGELFIAGDGVTRGYLNRPDLTAERFLPDPFVPGGHMYRTGDLVLRTASGEIKFLGRADHQVKVRGYRIELGEIEARLGLHPAVAEAVVVAREDKANDVRLVAYLRYKGAAPSEAELRDHVRAALPDFMVPAHFVTMQSFPLTPNAKVDRKALPRPDEKRAVAAVVQEFVVPAGEVQEKIAEAFRRALGVERVGMNDNFFALGGHSLLAVQVHRDLKKNVASHVSITDLYRFPTVAGLAAHIQGESDADQQLGQVAQRAAMRRNAMAGRRVFSRTREMS